MPDAATPPLRVAFGREAVTKSPGVGTCYSPTGKPLRLGKKSLLDQRRFSTPLRRNFRSPVIDFSQRGAALRRIVVAIERWNYPPLDRRPPLSGDDVQLEYYTDGYPKLPACLDRREVRAMTEFILPRRRCGRPTTELRASYEEEIAAFCAGILELRSGLDFEVGSRGWGYVCESNGLISKDRHRPRPKPYQRLPKGRRSAAGHLPRGRGPRL